MCTGRSQPSTWDNEQFFEQAADSTATGGRHTHLEAVVDAPAVGVVNKMQDAPDVVDKARISRHQAQRRQQHLRQQQLHLPPSIQDLSFEEIQRVSMRPPSQIRCIIKCSACGGCTCAESIHCMCRWAHRIRGPLHSFGFNGNTVVHFVAFT